MIKTFKPLSNRALRLQTGAALAEFGGALALILPILIVAGFVAFQVAQVHMIKTSLDFAAHTAARRLAISYGKNPVEAKAFPEKIFDQIRIAGIVVNSDQFSIPDGNAGWNTGSKPSTVTVNVVFQGNKFGLAPFPQPDPLGLGENFSLTSTATSRLE